MFVLGLGWFVIDDCLRFTFPVCWFGCRVLRLILLCLFGLLLVIVLFGICYELYFMLVLLLDSSVGVLCCLLFGYLDFWDLAALGGWFAIVYWFLCCVSSFGLFYDWCRLRCFGVVIVLFGIFIYFGFVFNCLLCVVDVWLLIVRFWCWMHLCLGFGWLLYVCWMLCCVYLFCFIVALWWIVWFNDVVACLFRCLFICLLIVLLVSIAFFGIWFWIWFLNCLIGLL